MLWILSGHTFEVIFTSVQPIIFLEYATAIKNFIKLSTSGMSPTSDVFSIFPRDSPCARRVMKQPRSQKGYWPSFISPRFYRFHLASG